MGKTFDCRQRLLKIAVSVEEPAERLMCKMNVSVCVCVVEKRRGRGEECTGVCVGV